MSKKKITHRAVSMTIGEGGKKTYEQVGVVTEWRHRKTGELYYWVKLDAPMHVKELLLFKAEQDTAPPHTRG